MGERIKLDAFLQAADNVRVLEALQSRYGSAAKKIISIQATVTINLDGQQVEPSTLQVVNRALAPVIQAQIVPLLTAAITRARAERDALKGAAKSEYDKLFI